MTGNVVYDPDSGNGYKYDAEGNITEVDQGTSVVAKYYYDALNRRVRSETGGAVYEYIFDQWGKRLGVQNGSTGSAMEVSLYWPNGGPVLGFDWGWATHFQHQDFTGTERLRTGYDGSIEGKYTSQPFGDGQATVAGSTNGANPHQYGDLDAYHYSELDHDSESGLDHAQFRNYNSAHAHWMSPDPYNGSYRLRDPQSLNRYTYALNRPLSSSDPTGLDSEPWCDDGDNYCDGPRDWDNGGSTGGDAGSGNSCAGCTVNQDGSGNPVINDPNGQSVDVGSDEGDQGSGTTTIVNVGGSVTSIGSAPSNPSQSGCMEVNGKTVCPSPLDNKINPLHGPLNPNGASPNHYRDDSPTCSTHVVQDPVTGQTEWHYDTYNPTYFPLSHLIVDVLRAFGPAGTGCY